VFVAPGDAKSLAAKLRWLLTNPAEIKQRADAAWAHAASLPRWQDAARKIAAVLQEVSMQKAHA
jgi:glycosyltransferase involved in cell wall biosynthesis